MEYFSLAILYLCDYKNSHGFRSTWLVSGILLGIASFIRQEAFWIPIILATLIISLKQKIVIQCLSFLTIFFIISSIWPTSISWISPIQHLQIETRTVARIMNDVTISNNLSYFGSLNTAIRGFWKSWSLIIIMFYLTILAQQLWLKKYSLSLIQFFGIFMSSCLIIGSMIFARRFSGWESLGDAVFRMGVIIIPVFWVGIITSPFWNILLNKGKR